MMETVLLTRDQIIVLADLVESTIQAIDQHQPVFKDLLVPLNREELVRIQAKLCRAWVKADVDDRHS